MTLSPQEILAKYPRPVPRYTSYPTAPNFNADGAEEAALMQFSQLGDAPVSLYLHIPFCNRLCWFCGCNTKHTLKYAPVAAYVQTLIAQIEQMRGRLGRRLPVAAVHFGGGSPSILQPTEILAIGAALEQAFALSPDTEVSVELDPAGLQQETLAAFKFIGMSRASLGVQDFDPTVQQAINRPQTYQETRGVIEQLRALDVASLNLDALYGLPHQTCETLERTLDQVVSLSPDRIALFGYAHVPWMKTHQRLMRDEDLPDATDRFAQAETARRVLEAHGYVPIGIDHFARPDDSLARAAATGGLRRNFQGYTTDPCEVLLGLGASAISRLPGAYLQNAVATPDWRRQVETGHSSVAKACVLSADDHMRAWVIERLMCDFEVALPEITRRFGPMGHALAAELTDLSSHDQDGLSRIDGDRLAIPSEAHAFARIVAARADAYLDAGAARYSRAV